MWLVGFSIVALMLINWQLDRFVLPLSSSEQKGPIVTLVSISPSLLFYMSILMLSYRPLLSLVVSVATYSIIVLLNNAKVKAVKEPLVYSDFHLVREIVKHPYLYTKYINLYLLLPIFFVGIICLVLAIYYEPPIIGRKSLVDYVPLLMFYTFLVGAIYLIVEGPLKKPFRKILLSFGPTASVDKNVSQLGLVVCLIFYFLLAREEKIKSDAKIIPQSLTNQKQVNNRFNSKEKLPNIIAVQAESFFDVRYLQSNISSSILENYDRLISNASFYGRLDVPAWGAFTMRTEFAFLSGLPEEILGQHKYNPYLQLANKPFWTIAHTLKALGYKTVCIHPFPASFFNRQKVFPNLGFDSFIDISHFGDKDLFGPYVGDIPLGEKIIETLEDSEEPVFIFAITMENHGAWSENRLDSLQENVSKKVEWPLGCYSLNHYLRHMKNTDEMIGNVEQYLTKKETPSVFCLYGDHMPNLQNAFNKIGYTDQKTDYFIWRSDGKRHRPLDSSADFLSRLLLDVALNERIDNSPIPDVESKKSNVKT